MDTVTIDASYGLAGQHLSFEGSTVWARFTFGDFPVPTVFWSPSTYTWRVGDRIVKTAGMEYAAALSSITVGQQDVGKQVAVSASVPYQGVIYSAESEESLTVVNVNDLPVGEVRITGDTRTAGSVLTAVNTITDEDGMGALSFQWRADGQAIAGATGATYTLGQLEAGKTITVVASYVDGFGQAESVASDADPKLVHVNSAGKLALTGTLAPWQTLRATVTDADHSGKVYYQWQADDGSGNYQNIPLAWDSEITIADTAPKVVRVLATYADRFGVIEGHATAIGTGGSDVLRGDASFETILAQGGDDTIYGTGRGDRIDGGDGLDTFITGHARYQFFQTNDAPGQWEVRDIIFSGDPYLLTNVERVLFSNGATGVALDYDGHAGQAYRLYQAAFDRKPDNVGQGFWMNRLDVGVGLDAIADAFVASNEFKTLYGASPSNADIVAKFYEHVLHRAPDAASGFWVDVLDRKAATVAQVLVGFSESAENIAALVGVKDTGIDFTPYTGS